jgi:hypothetical protein
MEYIEQNPEGEFICSSLSPSISWLFNGFFKAFSRRGKWYGLGMRGVKGDSQRVRRLK